MWSYPHVCDVTTRESFIGVSSSGTEQFRVNKKCWGGPEYYGEASLMTMSTGIALPSRLLPQHVLLNCRITNRDLL
jgi:hypothetical protein